MSCIAPVHCYSRTRRRSAAVRASRGRFHTLQQTSPKGTPASPVQVNSVVSSVVPTAAAATIAPTVAPTVAPAVAPAVGAAVTSMPSSVLFFVLGDGEAIDFNQMVPRPLTLNDSGNIVLSPGWLLRPPHSQKAVSRKQRVMSTNREGKRQ